MDPVRAELMSDELTGKSVGGWLIRKYKGAGKSAVVFEGQKDGQIAAVKIFDPELIQRFGKEAQLGRINRERSLIGRQHPNLVQILDGGECVETGYLYVAMEYIAAPDLEKCLTLVPRDKIAPIIQDIASAARFLEELDLAHRDIKPANIAVLPDFSKAVLLDLGVLRPFSDPGLTDDQSRPFVGTLQYSSPEFLLRQEDDSAEGWRAITFYQLGGVLHDLIMRRPLFEDFCEPFARLVEAVMKEKPEIHADDISPNLVILAENCLVKSPIGRLKLVSWKHFEVESSTRSSTESAKERVKQRALRSRSQSDGTASSPRLSALQTVEIICSRLEGVIRNECVANSAFPPMEIIMNGDGPIQITVVFAPTLKLDLPQQLSIRFDCELVDDATLSVVVDASACLLPTGASHGSPPARATVFRGPLDSDTLAKQVQGVLWCAMDLAECQGVPVAPADDARWLNLVEAVEA